MPLLEYLGEMGYDALYLPPGSVRSLLSADPDASPGVAPPTGATSTAAPSAAAHPSRADAPSAASPAPSAAASPTSPAVDSIDPHDTLFGVPPSGWERFTTLQELGDHARQCTRCRLAEGRRSVVFGSGNPDADLLFIGEGPGAEEDRQGLPFVGPAGALLTKMIEGIEQRRDDVYIANIVKCRPPGNRDPLPDEVSSCRGYLERQIDLIRPKVIVALGRVAAQTLLESALPLGRLRGRWHSVRGVAVRATYHPAALLRNPHWKRPTWEDLKVVRDRLASA